MKENIIFKREIPDLSQKKLSKIVRRHNSPLFNSILRVGASLRNPEFSFDNRIYDHVVLDNDIYSDEDDFNNLKSIMLKEIEENEDFIEEYLQKVIEDFKNMILWSETVKKKDFSKEDDKKLLETFNEFIERSLKLMGHLWPPLGPEEWILKELEKELSEYIDPKENFSQFQEVLNLLIAPEETSLLQQKREALLELAIDSKEINKVHERFAWINDHGFVFDYQTLDDLKEEIKNIGDDPQEQLRKIQLARDITKRKKQQTISKFQFNERFLKLIEYAQKLPLVRFTRIDCLIEVAYNLNKLFKELEKRLPIDEITLAYYWEIQDMLEDKEVDVKEINKRKDGYGFILFGNVFYNLTLAQARDVKEKIESKLLLEGELKGQVASMGYAKGRVKVLASAKEISKVEKGDILVTSMTTPDFVPAMEKAAAIVTDEGGLTCHASIVSREMETPCIVGTKVATKVLKDGDLVEVDAKNGTVKKISSFP